MRTKIIRIMIALSALILIAGFSYPWLKRYAEHARLSRLYKEGLQLKMDKDNSYYPEAVLANLNEMLNSRFLQPHGIKDLQYRKALIYLELGDEKKAIGLLDTVVANTKPSEPDPLIKNAWSRLGLAYLRLGERNNCLSGHCSGSCIFPIQGNGLYTDATASLKAIQIYETLLQGNPADLGTRWLLNLAYMTLGEYPAKVPPAWLIPGLDTDSSGYKLKPFRDMAGDLKLNTTRNMAGGAIVDDFNNDGYLDIVTSGWGLEESMHYYRNNADGTFTDLSKESGLSAIKGGLNIIQADYNNDGYTDILVLRGAWMQEFGKQPNSLLRNNGNG